ncbi:hypothetical protein D3C81_1831390 [compost metagenome]
MFRVDMTDQEQVARQCGFGQQQGVLFGKEQVVQMEDVDLREIQPPKVLKHRI